MTLRERARWALGRFRFLRTPAGAVLAAALAIQLGLYFSNHNRDKVWDDAKIGDGTYRPVLARGDGHFLYLMTRSIVLDGDLNLDNDLRRFGDPWRAATTVTGYRLTEHPIGPSLVYAPPFLVAHGIARVANLFGAGVSTHGYGILHQRAAFLVSSLFGFAAIVLGWRVARRLLGARWSPLYAAVAILFGTSLTYYVTYMPAYGHAIDAGVTGAYLAVWALGLGDTRWRRYLWLGALLGASALVRPQNFFLGALVALEVGWRAVRERPRTPAAAARLLGAGAVALGASFVVFLPQLWAWHSIFGEWFHQPAGSRYVRFDHPLVLETLFSARNGWFSTTPLAYAGVVGLLFAPRPARLAAAGLLLAVALEVWLDASILDWWASASYGNRRLVSMTLPCVVGLAALLSAAARLARRVALPPAARHALGALALAWFVVWNCGWVRTLARGKAAGHEGGGTSFAGLARPLTWIAAPIHRAIGNSFISPANVVFALRHDVPFFRWERIGGVSYVWVPPLDELKDGRYRKHVERWTAPDDRVVRGLGARRRQDGRDARPLTAARGELLVPILLPDALRCRLAVSAATPSRVAVRWNGALVAEADVGPGWSEVPFDVSEPEVGENELVIEGAPGVLVGPLVVGFVPD